MDNLWSFVLRRRHFSFLFFLFFTLTAFGASYTNPILYEDYSDPDVICVGNDYWMTASSFQCWPGLPILHSFDLVHWEVVNHAIKGPIPGGVGNMPVEHGNQVWAPSMRFHKGIYYIMWGDPDVGIYEVHASDPMSEWSAPHLVVPAKGYIDACPFWDEDGRTYIVHALANSRAGMKSVLLLTEVNEDFTEVIRPSRIFFDGHETQPTCEGPKLYKRGDYYYVMFPAGGVPTGWQTVVRCKRIDDVFGDNYDPSVWEEKIVMAQGKSPVNGPHQGGWVHTPAGEDWFIHFQDVGAVGRILHLQPMKWLSDGWPVIGEDKDADGCGDPVMKHKAPKLTAAQKALIKANKPFQVGYAPSCLGNLNNWQWQRAPKEDEEDVKNLAEGVLISHPVVDKTNLWQQQMVLKKIKGPDIEYTAQVVFNAKHPGDRFGFLVFGMDYAGLTLQMDEKGMLQFSYVNCPGASKGKKEQQKELGKVPASDTPLFLRIMIHSEDALPDQGDDDKRVTATFAYSKDGKNFTSVDDSFPVKEGKWIGAKVGFFSTCEKEPGGYAKLLTWEEKML